MLITILAAGSRGDVQPYIALGMALKNLGCQVRLATFESYAGLIQQHGLELFPVRGDLSQIVAGADGQAAMQADNPLKIALSFNQLSKYVYELQADFFAACAGASAIVYHPGAVLGYFIARQRQIPGILATPFPMTPTRAYPSLVFYDAPRFGKMVNLATHKLFEQIMWSTARGAARRFLQTQFGRLPEDFGSPFPRQVTARYPTLIGCSPLVFPQPDDWSPHIYQSGYWLVPDEPAWTPPPGLLDFLQSGAPPVYVGFGSLSEPNRAAQTTAAVLAALRAVGQRGVLATGWNGLEQPADLPAEIYMLESAPHSWLFPRMATVVHHGGAGTTAAALHAGVPQVVIPHSNDQFAWARRMFELGVAAAPLPRKQLSAQRLAAALQVARSAPLQTKARALGEQLNQENGAAAAAQRIIQSLQAAG